jgi:diguanylate cyclase (GGDEF)-like protein
VTGALRSPDPERFAPYLLACLRDASGADAAEISLQATPGHPAVTLRDPPGGAGGPKGAPGVFEHRFALGNTRGVLRLRPVDDAHRDTVARCVEVGLGLLDLVTEFKTAKDQAATDALTGLPNRRAVSAALTRVLAEERRYGGRPFALAMLDLNNFKWFNDTYGHPAGDDLLRALADVLRRTTREADIAARWGGDEFLVLMPQTCPDDTAAMLGRTARDLDAFLAQYESNGVRLSFAAGVSSYPEDGNEADELIRRADERLYEAKRRVLGRA